MEKSEFAIGCPVLAASVEQYINDFRDGEPAQADAQGGLLAMADQAFAGWQKIIAAALRRKGVPAARARRLATLTVAAVEGSIALCRAARSGRPLEEAHVELHCLISMVLADARAG